MPNSVESNTSVNKSDFTHRVNGKYIIPFPCFFLLLTAGSIQKHTWLNAYVYLSLSFAGPIVQFLDIDELDMIAGQRCPYMPCNGRTTQRTSAL